MAIGNRSSQTSKRAPWWERMGQKQKIAFWYQASIDIHWIHARVFQPWEKFHPPGIGYFQASLWRPHGLHPPSGRGDARPESRQKEKKQQDIKLKYIANVGIDELVDNQDGDTPNDEAMAFVDNLRSRIDGVRANDLYWKDIVTEEKKKTRKRRAVNVDSDLKDFLE